MGKVALDISMSLDGFIAGPNPTLEEPLGAGGERLHEWTVGLASWRERHGYPGGARNADDEVVAESVAATGAVTDGFESAVEQARDAAVEKHVLVAGGASLAQQVLRAGLLDELPIHLTPVLLGRGTRLLEDVDPALRLESTRVIESPAVTHLRFEVVAST
jgi:riboflavin biosynthesis pyrimidine reductase